MAKNLVIVESPSKSKTIEKYLGKDYKVVSSKGHIRDLATTGQYGLGVDIENGFKPNYIPIKGKGKIIKGDFKSITISAASVIAKVTRDRMLDELDKKYPMYDFKDNKGYPTKKHLAAIEEYGIIPEHRKSYGPVRDYLEKQLSLFQE